MSIINASWHSTQPNLADNLQKVHERISKITGSSIIDAEVAFNMLAAVEYGRQLNCKEHAKEVRRLKKRYKRKVLSKQRQ